MRAALCTLSPGFRLELIQPLAGRSPYSESLERHGGRDHVHHLRLDVADYAAASEHLRARGLDDPARCVVRRRAGPEPRLRATYFDTEDELGVDARDRRRAARLRHAGAGRRLPTTRRGGTMTTTTDARPAPTGVTLDPEEERRYRERTPRSLELLERTRRLIPTGHGGGMWYQLPYPVLLERGKGCWIWDVDGNSTSTSASATG